MITIGIISWLLLGIFPGLGMLYVYHYVQGNSIVIEDVGYFLIAAVLGPLTLLLWIFMMFDEYKDVVLIKGKE